MLMSKVDPDEYTEFVESLTGPRRAEEKPPMMTEAAAAIPVPSWWKGPVTTSQAAMIAAGMRTKED